MCTAAENGAICHVPTMMMILFGFDFQKRRENNRRNEAKDIVPFRWMDHDGMCVCVSVCAGVSKCL